MEGPSFSSTKGYLTTGQEELILGQEELILLQEKVKNGKMSVDEALEKFKRWQMGKSGLEIMQQVIRSSRTFLPLYIPLYSLSV